jgi:hypothetical protein
MPKESPIVRWPKHCARRSRRHAEWVWRLLLQQSTGVIAVLTAVNIMIGFGFTCRQLRVLQRNSNLEYRPYVFITPMCAGGDGGRLAGSVLTMDSLGGMRIGLDGLTVRNTGKGPAREVLCGAYVSPARVADRRQSSRALTVKMSLPPGNSLAGSSSDIEWGDSALSLRMSGDAQRCYLHLFVRYCDVSGQWYSTEMLYAPDSAVVPVTGQQQAWRWHYVSATIR